MDLLTITNAPWLARFSGEALFTARLILGVVMIFYGWGKIKNPRANAADFEANIARPGWLFGNMVLVTEFFGGMAVIFGVFTSLAAAAIALEMGVGTFMKAIVWKKPFSDYSYDILIFALCIIVLAFGAGSYNIEDVILQK